MNTQCKKILDLLSDGKEHASIDIRENLYIVMVATRIWDLKQKGYDIVKEMKPYNNGASIAWYKLNERSSK